MKIPLPRPPQWLERRLDRYSEWADRPAGQALRMPLWLVKRGFPAWRYDILVMDWATIGCGAAMLGVYALLTSWMQALVLGVPCFILSWMLYEWFWRPR